MFYFIRGLDYEMGIWNYTTRLSPKDTLSHAWDTERELQARACIRFLLGEKKGGHPNFVSFLTDKFILEGGRKMY